MALSGSDLAGFSKEDLSRIQTGDTSVPVQREIISSFWVCWVRIEDEHILIWFNHHR